jgi:hypothetical protein
MKNLYDNGTLFWYYKIQGKNEYFNILYYVNLIVIGSVEQCKVWEKF